MKCFKVCWFYVKKVWLWISMLFNEFGIQGFVLIISCLAYFVAKSLFPDICECTSESNDDLLTFLGGIIAIMAGLFVYKAQKRLLCWDIRNRLVCELKEMYRHLQRNLEVLKQMDVSMGKPSAMHIEKLRIDDHKTLTDEEIMKNMSKKYTYLVFPLTVRMRNYNITVGYLEKALKDGQTNLFVSYLKEMKSITESMQRKIDKDAKEILVYDIIKALQREDSENNCINKKKRTIIYDGIW